jgi:outer membrane protein OmpA-like peptidoglycan-associated protein
VTTTVTCTPGSVEVGETTTCEIVVVDTAAGTPVNAHGATVTASSDTSGGTLGNGGSCVLVPFNNTTAGCSVTYEPGQPGSGTHQITADFPASDVHDASQGSGPVQVAAFDFSLTAPNIVVTKSKFGATCSVDPGQLTSCTVSALPTGASAAAVKPLAKGSASSSGARSLRVGLRLTGRGKRKVRRSLGGVQARLNATAVTVNGSSLSGSDSTVLLARRQKLVPPGAMFEPNSPEFTPHGRRVLRRIASRLRHVKSIRCEGHTASLTKGPTDEANDLGLARARAACALLKRLGVRAKFKAVSLGKRNPRSSNQTDSGRSRNRYVSLVITHGR